MSWTRPDKPSNTLPRSGFSNPSTPFSSPSRSYENPFTQLFRPHLEANWHFHINHTPTHCSDSHGWSLWHQNIRNIHKIPPFIRHHGLALCKSRLWHHKWSGLSHWNWARVHIRVKARWEAGRGTDRHFTRTWMLFKVLLPVFCVKTYLFTYVSVSLPMSLCLCLYVRMYYSRRT